MKKVIKEETEDSSNKPKEIKKCPDCKGEVINKNGELYCKKCGLVID